MLAKLTDGKTLFRYLALLEYSINAVLAKEKNGEQVQCTT